MISTPSSVLRVFSLQMTIFLFSRTSSLKGLWLFCRKKPSASEMRTIDGQCGDKDEEMMQAPCGFRERMVPEEGLKPSRG